MTFLRRLFGKEPINPEEYERVRCELCGGSGVRAASTMPRPLVRSFDSGVAYRPRVRKCGKCHGKGWLLVKKGA